MNVKTILIGLVVLAVVGGGAFMVLNKDDSGDEAAPTSQTNSENASERSSIKGLLAQNKNLKCTFSSLEDNGVQTSGTLYFASNRMRGNFTLQSSGEAEQKSNMLRDDEYQYMWSEGSATGVKISNASVDSADQGEQSQQSVDQDQEYDFDCDDWAVDNSLFEVPAGIEFTDYSAQLQDAQQQLQDVQQTCAQITDSAARAACENAL